MNGGHAKSFGVGVLGAIKSSERVAAGGGEVVVVVGKVVLARTVLAFMTYACHGSISDGGKEMLVWSVGTRAKGGGLCIMKKSTVLCIRRVTQTERKGNNA